MRKNEAIWIESRQRWQIKVQIDGVRRIFTDATPGKKGKIAAERKADDWIETRVVGENTRCEVLLDAFYDGKKRTTSKGNCAIIDYHIRLYIKPAIGKKRIGSLTENDLQRVIDMAYGEGLAKKTLLGIRGTLTAFIKYCRKEKATMMFPESLVIPHGAKARGKNIAQPEDIKKLFSCDCTERRGKEHPDRLIHMYRFAVLLGLRPGELIGIQKTDIRGDILHIRGAINKYGDETDGKNENANRRIRIGKLTQKELDAQAGMLRSEGLVSKYVFPQVDGGPVTQRQYRDAWHKFCEHNGISHITPYELRHTFVSVNDDMPDGLKKRVMGHSESMDTEGVYGHEKDGDLKRISDFIDGAFGKIIGL